ncbi:MAG: radical SAM protein, partial [Dehalococcoidia bacterium]
DRNGLPPLDEPLLAGTEAVFISVPMHTAARLGLALARRVRAGAPEAAIAFFGTYAGAVAQLVTREHLADALISGEFERPAHDWLASPGDLVAGPDGPRTLEGFARDQHPVPDRHGLPPLDRYARLRTASGLRITGHTETTRGCAHRCTHCPLTPVYGGRLRLVAAETVLADIEQQVAAGATHITFGDPDFLNAVPHSLAICRELHQRHPHVSFDMTAKVEHLVADPPLLEKLKSLGCLFVTSAFESTSAEVLERLGKGHSPEDLLKVVEISRDLDLPGRPTWMAFTPWTRRSDYLGMLAFIDEHQLADAVQPLQYGLRLLLPPGSPLINAAAADGLLGDFDEDGLTYRWRSRETGMDALQQHLEEILRSPKFHDCGTEGAPRAAFERVHREAAAALGTPPPRRRPPGSNRFVPGLTEDWFC